MERIKSDAERTFEPGERVEVILGSASGAKGTIVGPSAFGTPNYYEIACDGYGIAGVLSSHLRRIA